MNGTVKQFKDTLEVMRKVYPFKDDTTRMQTRDITCLDHNHLSIITQDEETGVWVELSRNVMIEKRSESELALKQMEGEK